MVLGYMSGVFDLFHIGHLNIIKNSKELCDKLIVGVTTDELIRSYKKKNAIIPFEERCEIVRNIKGVSAVVPQYDMNKMDTWKRYKFDIMFVGDDWYETPKWEKIEKELKDVGVKIIYFPYTKGTSSTKINEILDTERSRKK